MGYRIIYHTPSWFKILHSLHVYGMSTFSEFVNFVEDCTRYRVEYFKVNIIIVAQEKHEIEKLTIIIYVDILQHTHARH